MSTPHIAAEPGDFAPDVLLPGDPLRARWIAEHVLDDARPVTSVRNMLGYTGTVGGRPVSVMGTGMGMPSTAIYATELITRFGCRRLIRVGSCGALQPEIALRSVVVAVGACTDSGINRQFFGGFDYAATAHPRLLVAALAELAGLEASGVTGHAGNVLSSDLFDAPDPDVGPLDWYAPAVRMGVLAVEMEAAVLYAVAALHRVEALAVCTVSDQLVTGEHLGPDERERSFGAMVGIALATLSRAAAQ